MADFPDDYACAEHLAERRWPDGFVCPHCGSRKGWRLEAKPWVWECAGKGEAPGCRRQTSVISGTVMHGTHLPLRTWFIAAYLVATHSNGISALQLQPKIGVGSYKTAWLLLHKLRRAMVAPDRTPLEGDVEIDETSIPFRRADESPTGGQGKSTVGKMFIIGAVEKRGGRSAGRIRLQRIPEDTGRYIRPFVEENTAPGSAIYTDANSSYLGVPGRTHIPRNLSARNELPAHITFERIHRVFSNLKRWGAGHLSRAARQARRRLPQRVRLPLESATPLPVRDRPHARHRPVAAADPLPRHRRRHLGVEGAAGRQDPGHGGAGEAAGRQSHRGRPGNPDPRGAGSGSEGDGRQELREAEAFPPGAMPATGRRRAVHGAISASACAGSRWGPALLTMPNKRHKKVRRLRRGECAA